MVIEIKKQEKETLANLLRRFAKRVKESGVLTQVRARQFKQRATSKKTKKELALRRLKSQKKLEWLRKLGKAKQMQKI